MVRWRVILLSTVPITISCFAGADVILAPGAVVPNTCVFNNTGVYDGSFVMVPVYEDTVYTCERGYFLPMGREVCEICPENSYCSGGEYAFSETDDSGIVPCPDGSVAPIGMWDVAQCGRILHVNDAYIYLRRAKQTAPSLHIDVDGDGTADFFANLTPYDVVMNKNTDLRLRVKMGDVVYSVHDDTIDGTVSMPISAPADSGTNDVAPVDEPESEATPVDEPESEATPVDEPESEATPVDENVAESTDESTSDAE